VFALPQVGCKNPLRYGFAVATPLDDGGPRFMAAILGGTFYVFILLLRFLLFFLLSHSVTELPNFAPQQKILKNKYLYQFRRDLLVVINYKRQNVA
jgi:hypothetical protein